MPKTLYTHLCSHDDTEFLKLMCPICTPEGGPLEAQFDGDDYVDSRDRKRLKGQMRRVYDCLSDYRWWTVDDVCRVTGDRNGASISAQNRNLRKPKFGAYIIQKQHRGHGLYAFRMLPQEESNSDS